MSSRPKVYITRQIPQSGLNLLLGTCNVSYWDSAYPAPRAELLMNIPGVDVLLCMPTDIVDKDVLQTAGPSLRIVATMSEDSYHIDVVECKRRNIRIVTMETIAIETIRDLTVAMLAVATRSTIQHESQNLNKLLQSANIVDSIRQDQSFCVELSNRTVGIIGMGPLGMSVGTVLNNLGASTILYHDVSKEALSSTTDVNYVSQKQLFSESDIVCVCSNLKTSNSETSVFNMQAFQSMKSSVILIDATKGFMANFIDLYEALRTGTIGAAGLDVREHDVIPNRHPLAALDNCYFLPFRECYKWDSRREMSDKLAKSILNTLAVI